MRYRPFKKGDFLVKTDLKYAYLTVPIWKPHFLWNGSLVELACVPFGLATAPRVFTTVVAFPRQMGIQGACPSSSSTLNLLSIIKNHA